MLWVDINLSNFPHSLLPKGADVSIGAVLPIGTNENVMIISDEKHSNSDTGSQSTQKRKTRDARPNTLSEALPTLSPAPTLAPILELKAGANASDISETSLADAGIEMIENYLKVMPTGSIITFAADDLGALLLPSAILGGDELYRKAEDLAQACSCSVSLEKEAGTIAFCRE
jgi:hypothetical protein